MAHIDYHYENRLIRKSAVHYIIPAILGLVFGQISPMIGGICISQSLGEVPFSALSTVEPINLVFNVIGSLGGIGCGITVSKCSGSGDKGMAARAFTRTAAVTTAVTILACVLIEVFADPLLVFLRATPDNYGYAREYLRILTLGSIFTVFLFAFDYVLTDDNDPRRVLAANVTAAVVNIAGNVIGMEVLHQGIWVSAFSMLLGNFVGCLVCLPHFWRKDSLCRLVPPKRHEGDPSMLAILKPGTPTALMYAMSIVQMLVQNFVLVGEAGTSGLGNSAVIDNLVVFLTIFTAAAGEPVMALASSYCGEENRCGMLLVKRMMLHVGGIVVMPIILILMAFPQVFMAIFAVSDPVMLESLPFAIRIVCLSEILVYVNDLMVGYLAATERENVANVSYVIQAIVNITVTILVAQTAVSMDAPWYGAIVASAGACLFLLLAGKLAKGFIGMYPENVEVLTGGHATVSDVDAWEHAAAEVLTPEQQAVVHERLLVPFLSSPTVSEEDTCSFTVLRRDNGDVAAILRCATKVDPLGIDDSNSTDEPDEDELAHVYGTCVSSEFNTLRRLAINFAAG